MKTRNETRLREHAKRFSRHPAARSALSERAILDIAKAADSGDGVGLEHVLVCCLSNPVARVILPVRLLADMTRALASYRGLSPANQVSELSAYAEGDMAEFFAANCDEPI